MLLVLVIGSLSANTELPDLGDPSLKDFSSRTEERYGELFYRTLRANASFVDDLLIEHYISSLGQKLLTHSDAAGDDFKFFVIRSNAINAFAGPDAHIGVNSGLILRARNESELAGVMAHEIAHVSQRHLARMFSRQGNSAAIGIGAIIAAILVGSQSPDAAQAILATGVAGSYQGAINFTRDNEYEADRIGIGIMSDAGIDPRGMVGFFRTLLEESRGLQIEYLRTHPLNVNRVSEAQYRIDEMDGGKRADSEDFRFAKARIQMLTTDDPEDLLLEAPAAPHEIYRQALVLLYTAETDRAVELLDDLQADNTHPWVKLALVGAYRQQGDDATALELATSMMKLYPGYLPATLTWADLSLQMGKDADAVITKLKHQLQTQDRAIVHKLLAQAYYQNEQIAAALEATGNQYLLQGYAELALQQFENALKQKDISESDIRRIEARIKLIKPTGL